MDTSASILKDPITIAPSMNITDYLLPKEEFKVNLETLTPFQKLDLLKELIDTVKPYLRYFHEFKEVKSLLHQNWQENIKLDTRIEFYRGDINYGTKAISLTTKLDLFESARAGKRKIPIASLRKLANMTTLKALLRQVEKSGKFKFTMKERLILTQSGELFIAQFRFRNDSPVAYSIEFSQLKDEALLTYLNEPIYLLHSVIAKLHWVLNSGIARREEQLEKLKKIDRTIERLQTIITI